MLEFEDFKKYMLEIKDQIDKERKLDEALHEMSPDFGGFSTNSITLEVELLKRLMLDEEDWIGYYIWEADWGETFPNVYDSHGEAIPLTLENLYKLIVEKGE